MTVVALKRVSVAILREVRVTGGADYATTRGVLDDTRESPTFELDFLAGN
jgi:hypothetical protein